MNRKWIYILLISALCVTAFCFVAIIFRIFSLSELPFYFVAAFLEAVITAIITVVLLKGQTDAEEIKERNAKVFEIKMPLFQNYINTTWEIWEKAEITAKKYRKMTKLFYHKIMLYLPKKSMEIISTNLLDLGDCIGKEKKEIYSKLADCTFSIINELVMNIGLGGKVDKDVHSRMEEKIYQLLFKPIVKEALDNVLVNYSDYCLLNRGEYEKREDGEYLAFPFINNHPCGCKIMIGPFTSKPNTDILFQLYVPRYIPIAVPDLSVTNGEINSYVDLNVEEREMPLSVSRPLKDSHLIELEQEDCYNDYIPSFSFNDRNSSPYCRNYTEIAFALGQRAKYIFLNAGVRLEGMYLYDYVDRLEKIDPHALYPSFPWKLDESGDLLPEES
jgi:hypothetical protein